MRKIKGILMMVLSLVFISVLAACSEKSGVKARLSVKKSTSTSITIQVDFDKNKKLIGGEASPYIKQYNYDTDSKKYVYASIKQDVDFDNEDRTSGSATFNSLSKDKKYKFVLYVTFDDSDEKIESIETQPTEMTEINSIEDFNNMVDNPAGEYTLMKDLDFTGADYKNPFASKAFTGKFNGNNKTITGLYFASASNVGLFGNTNGAEIKDLTIEKVVADYSSGRSSINLGAVVGKAINTKISNVEVSDVTYKLKCNSTAVINVGGIAGMVDSCSFTNVSATNVTIDASERMRQKFCAGLFVGQSTGSGKDKAEITYNVNGTPKTATKTIFAKDCFATGKITGCLYYPSSSTSSSVFTRIGGFVGDHNANGYLIDCYADADILVTKSTLSTNTNEFYLCVGGFIGTNGSGATINVHRCFTNADVKVYAGAEPKGETAEAKEAEINKLCENMLATKTSYIGGFIGQLNYPVGIVADSMFRLKSELVVAAKEEGYVLTDDKEVDTTKDYRLATVTYEATKVEYPEAEDLSEYFLASLTEDTEINAKKSYFVYDDVADKYTSVVSPKAADLATYYELTAATEFETDGQYYRRKETGINYDVKETNPLDENINKYYEYKTCYYKGDVAGAAYKETENLATVTELSPSYETVFANSIVKDFINSIRVD